MTSLAQAIVPFMDVASHQQGQRTDPGRDRFAGLVRRGGQRQQCSPVTLKAFADRLAMSTQSPLTSPEATAVQDAR